mmetsp:Transcript_43295/g.92672  ORF Transcript_43295/g.92672 Transcript_43295/m.92672 type:complete len:793 (-) Transcript_43295:96-2474(-)|eukprot:CAMPEP_0206434246 /NCGR_PEP_ID=MMETSP0324_2-20121206/9041_1 /ASSEMBLY_ACC=CAM_ASM_000836 /TAXON_ID=2866 /ORGANISM="Crypthecodinium cohnii, Strain Seligo" /LENGTH=792 /DNA_ID=CAMNT_0053900719 /DNA_START=63 /DNA_END=2441 /DNA_ORIENTATION=+
MASQKEEATRLLLQAERSLVDDWSYENTLEASRKSLQLYQNSQDLTGIARATLLVAQSLVRKAPASENKDAKEFVAERRALATSSGDRHLQAALSVAEAELALDLRLSEAVRDAALEGARDAKATLIDLGDRELEAKATVAISMVLIKKCDAGAGPKCAREALKYAREAASMSQELEDRRLEAKCNFLLFSAKMYTESPWRDAIKYAKEACKIFKQVGAKWWSAVVSKTAADWAVMKGNGQDGVPFAQDAMDIFREVASDHAFGRAWEAASLNTLIAALADRGEEGREQALEVARDGADRLQATGDTLASAQAKLCLSGAYAQYGDIDDAIKAGEDALKLYRSLGDKQSELVCLGELSRLQMEAKEHGEALDICQDAVQLARESGDTRHEGRNLAALIRAHLTRRDVEKALEVSSEALAFHQKHGDKEGEGVVLLSMASAHMLKESWDVAASECEEARCIFHELDMKDRQAQCWFFMAEIYNRSNRFEPALNAAGQARTLYQKLNDKVEEASMLYLMVQNGMSWADKIGNSSSKESQRRARRILTSALRASKEGLAISRKLPEKDQKQLLNRFLYAVGQASAALGKHKDALKAANEGMRLAVDQVDRHAECGMLVLFAMIHHWNEQPGDAKSYATKALELSRKLKDAHLESMAVDLLSQIAPQGAAPSSSADAAAAAAAAAAADAGPAEADSKDQNAAAGPYAGPTSEVLIPKINELAMSLLSTDELHEDTPLMDSGLDSLSMVQFRNVLQQQFPGVPMPASLVFDHPTVRAVSDHILEELQAAHASGRALT